MNAQNAPNRPNPTDGRAKSSRGALCALRAAAARAKAAEEQAHELEVVPYLRTLGYNAREARDAAALCRDMRDAPLEQRVRIALTYFRLKCTKVPAPGTPVAASTNGTVRVAAGP